MDSKLAETLKRLKEGKRAAGMPYSKFNGEWWVKREEVIKLEEEYWESQSLLSQCEEWINTIVASEDLADYGYNLEFQAKGEALLKKIKENK